MGRPDITSAIVFLLAILVLNASITLQSVWPTPGVMWRGELSVELAVLVLGGAAAAGLGWLPGPRVLTLVSAAWVALVLSRYAQVTAPALYGRDINLYWDLQHVSGVVAMLGRAASWHVIALTLSGVVVALGVMFLAARWAVERVARWLTFPTTRRALLVASGLTCVVYAGQRVGGWPEMPRFATPVLTTFARQLDLVATAWAAKAGATDLAASPAFTSDLAHVRGADVLLVFIESYGAVSDDQPAFARALTVGRERLASAISETNRDVVSAYVESPTFGGSSWLAHISLLSGIEVRDPDTNARLMAERRETLVTTFARGGYRTVAVMPGLQQAWPEGGFYGFDTIYGTARHEYGGPPFGWWTIPDQYAFAMLQARELAPAARAPLFVFFPTITTHAPFSPVPPYQPDWPRMLTRTPYDAADLDRAYASEPDWMNLGPHYVRTLDYALTVVAGFLRAEGQRDLVVILLGDHQPLAAVSGEGARWDVPVHVITSRGAVLERLTSAGFRPGLTPASPALGKMHTLTPVLLEAFGERVRP